MGTGADVFDYQVIASDVRRLRIATDNKLEREAHPRLDRISGAQPLIHSLFKVSANAFQSVMFLCTDSNADPGRRPEFAIAAPPLLRVLADSLFSIVLLFDDLQTNVPWYWTSGWREMYRRYTQWEERHRNDPAWTHLLAQQRRFIDSSHKEWGIGHSEKLFPENKHWPYSSRMPRAARCPQRKAFLNYLKAWVYGPLSSSTHLSGPGLTTSASFLFARGHLDDYEERLAKYTSDQVFMALTLLFAIVSELEVEVSLGLADRLAYLWVIIGKYAWAAEDLYLKRYQALLGFPSGGSELR